MYKNSSRMIAIDDTRFIFATNFSGLPENDRFADTRRKANLLIPDPKQAEELMRQGFKVRQTKPRQNDDPETFVPEYFVTVLLKYRDRFGNPIKYPPKVYLVANPDSDPVPLDEDSVGMLDNIRVRNVNVVLNPYEFDTVNHSSSLYIRTMYVEQDLDDDPYAERYRRHAADSKAYAIPDEEEEPF